MKAKIPVFLKFLLTPSAKKVWDKGAEGKELSKAHEEAHLHNHSLLEWFSNVYQLHITKFSTSINGPTLELGSGGSRLKEMVPELITSDVIALPNIDRVVDAQNMDFKNCELANITMVNVLHHITRPLVFFAEANRVLKPGGRLILTEPHVSFASYPVYKFLHHEPCDLKNNILQLESQDDSLLNANQAMPTMLLRCHSEKILEAAPELVIKEVIYHSMLSYFLTGGVNFRSLLPLWLWKVWDKIDNLLCLLFGRYLAGFMTIVIEKRP